MTRGLDDLLLASGHGFERQLHTEIASRDHDGIGEGQDLVERLQRGGFLDLGEDACPSRGHLPQLRDVVRALHEGETEPIDRKRERVIEIGAILGRERGDRQQRIGEVDALVVLDRTALHHIRRHAVLFDLMGDEANLAVVDQEIAAGLERRENLRMRDGNGLRVGRGLAPHESDARSGLKLPLGAELAQAQFRSLQIDENGDRPTELGFDGPHGLDQRLQIGMRGVAHVDAEDIRTGKGQRAQMIARVAGGAQRRHDLDHAASTHPRGPTL